MTISASKTNADSRHRRNIEIWSQRFIINDRSALLYHATPSPEKYVYTHVRVVSHFVYNVVHYTRTEWDEVVFVILATAAVPVGILITHYALTNLKTCEHPYTRSWTLNWLKILKERYDHTRSSPVLKSKPCYQQSFWWDRAWRIFSVSPPSGNAFSWWLLQDWPCTKPACHEWSFKGNWLLIKLNCLEWRNNGQNSIKLLTMIEIKNVRGNPCLVEYG